MNDFLTRRSILKRGSAAVTLAMLAEAFGAAPPAGSNAQAAGPMVLTMLYPAGSFDFDLYRNSYLKTLKAANGGSVERIELRKVIAPPQPPGAAPPAMPFSAVVNTWIKDPAAYFASLEKHVDQLTTEAARITKLVPVAQIDTVYSAVGAARNVPQVGERCLMFLYPNSGDARWDVDKYRTSQMPLIMELYGKAIRRFEVRKGERTVHPDGKPAYLGLVHIYVADQAAMQAAGRKNGQRLMSENATYSSVDPLTVPSLIHGVV